MSRKIYLYTTAIIFIISITSCTSKKESKSSIPITELQGKDIAGDDFTSTSLIMLTDDYLFFQEMLSDSIVGIYKEENGILTKKGGFLKKGIGPHEVILPHFSYNKDGNKLIVLNSSGGTITKGYKIKADPISKMHNKDEWEEIDFKWLKKFFLTGDYTAINDSLLIVNSGIIGENNIISILNMNSETIHSLNFWPKDEYDGPAIPKQMIYTPNSRIFKNRDNKFLFVGNQRKYMETFEISDNKTFNHNVIFDIKPKYTNLKDGMNYGFLDNKFGRLTVATTDKYIYASYSEYEGTNNGNLGNFKGYPPYYTDKIEVLDWEGNSIKEYHLQTPFYHFIVNDDDSKIYTLAVDNNQEKTIVMKYDIEM